MKVLQVITDTNIGGAGIWLLNFLGTYDRDAIEMAVVLPRSGALVPRVEELGVRVIEADGISDRSFSQEGVGAMRRIFCKERPDIVHTHASLSARIAAKMCGVGVVNTRHCLEAPKHGAKKLVYRMVNSCLSDRVIGVAEAVCDNLRSDGISERKLRLVYNGIAPLAVLSPEERATVRREYGIPEGSIAVGIAARLEPVKNHRMFLKMARAVISEDERTVFVIAGTGSLEEQLRSEAEEAGLGDRVIFTGYVKNVERLVNAIDVYALTSDSEALNISLLEAMSVGRPVVATDVGGTPEIVENGVSGVLVPAGDAAAAARAVLDYVRSPELRVRHGRSGQERVRERFSVADMARKVEEIYRELA